MAEDEQKPSEGIHQEVSLDLHQVRTQAEQTYDALLAEVPQLVQWSKLVQDVAASTSPSAPLFQAIQENAHQMIDIPAISWTSKRGIREMREMPSLKQWRKDQVEVIAKHMQSINIHVTPTLLEAPLPDDPEYRTIHNRLFKPGKDPEEGLLDILANVQKEFVTITYATRTLAETRAIMQLCAPDIPWPTGDILAFASNRIDRGYQENGGWLLLPSGKHVIIIFEPFKEVDQYIRLSQQTGLITTGDRADKFFIATHEAGHGGFSELFDPQDAQTALGMTRGREGVRLTGALTEGYAMLLEQLAAEISYSDHLGADILWVDRGLETIQRRRSEGLVQDEYKEKGQVYRDGFALMQTLMEQMNISNHPSTERIIKLREFLSSVDIVQAADIGPEDERYIESVSDPYNKLPRKRKE